MRIPDFGRCPDHQRARVIVLGVLFVLLLFSMGVGNALGRQAQKAEQRAGLRRIPGG